MEGKAGKPLIWIIDRQQWPRACLRAELLERGFEAVGFAGLSPALTALHGPDQSKPRLIVLELCDLKFRADELIALERAGIPIIALGGAVEFNEETVKKFAWKAVLRRPCSIGEIADAVVKASHS